MIQQNFHIANNPTPTFSQSLPILQKLGGSYKIWRKLLKHFPRLYRYTLGAKIDNTYGELIELTLFAGYSSKLQKMQVVEKASTKLDALKFFLQISWELNEIEDKKYITISEPLNEYGKMLGGWKKQINKETPPINGRE